MRNAENHMNCDWVQENLEAYLDQELTAAEAAGLESHVALCSTCAAELALARQVQLELQSLPQQRCPDEVVARVLEQSRVKQPAAEEQGLSVWDFHWLAPAWRLATAAALFLVVICSALLLKSSPPPREPLSPEQIVVARQQVELTLAYIGQLGYQSVATVQEDVFESRVLTPVEDALDKVMSIRIPPLKTRNS